MPPSLPIRPEHPKQWIYGAGTIQYLIARDPRLDPSRYDATRHADRIAQVSALMDATDPDLDAFAARNGRLIVMTHLADYAIDPYAAIDYYTAVVARAGTARAARFMRLYAAPGVDHVGNGAPANVDMLEVLSRWVEQGLAPGDLEVVAQQRTPPFAVTAALPLCRWPAFPRYKGSGDPKLSDSYACTLQFSG